MKKCFKCLQLKELTEFYKHPQMADGRLNKCKECAKLDSREHGSNPEYEKKRAKLPHRIALRKKYSQTQAGKEAHRRGRVKYASSEHGMQVIAKNQRLYRKNNPSKYTAHNKVMIAIRNGTMEKQPCENCGAIRVHAHHDDYSKPLAVRWLCPPCHRKEHMKSDMR